MIDEKLEHIGDKNQVRVLTEPFLYALKGPEETKDQVVIVEYLTGPYAERMDFLLMEHLVLNWKIWKGNAGAL